MLNNKNTKIVFNLQINYSFPDKIEVFLENNNLKIFIISFVPYKNSFKDLKFSINIYNLIIQYLNLKEFENTNKNIYNRKIFYYLNKTNSNEVKKFIKNNPSKIIEQLNLFQKKCIDYYKQREKKKKHLKWN